MLYKKNEVVGAANAKNAFVGHRLLLLYLKDHSAGAKSMYPGIDTSPCMNMFSVGINCVFFFCAFEDRGGVHRRAPGSTAVERTGHFGPASWGAHVSILKNQAQGKVMVNLVFLKRYRIKAFLRETRLPFHY